MSGQFASQAPPFDHRRRMLALGAACAPLAGLVACGGGSGMHDGATVLADPPVPPGVADSARALQILALDEGELDAAGTRRFALRAQAGTTQFVAGVQTSTLGYNGALLGPALRLRSGERTLIRVRNELGETTTAHWHGLVVPATDDGGPHQTIAPGATWEAEFTVRNPASTCWFHPHGHGSTGRQVAAGLAGLLIIDDGTVAPTVLPDTWGVDDLALVLQDKRFTAAGQIDYRLTASDAQVGYTGDRLLVNGVIAPTWQAPQQWVRLRLLNGCNARILSLRWSDAATMLQIANEAGLLAVPVARSAIMLAPGERAEVLLNLGLAARGQVTRLLARAVSGGCMGMGMGSCGDGGIGSEVTALTINVSRPRQPGAMVSAPVGLPSAPSVMAGAGAALRSFTLEGGMMGEAFTINGRRFDIGRIDLRMPAGGVEVWRIFNATAMAHPMHVHGVRMSLLSRGGSAPASHERGGRDTFIVEAMQTVSIAVQASAVASAVPLMFHCHILEHEDAGMMAQFITV
jgi:blue copper oxidase